MRGSGSARREGRAGHSRSPADAVPASLSARHRRLCSCAWDRAVASTSSVTPSHQSKPPIPLPLTSLSRPPPLPPRPLAPGAPPTARTDSPSDLPRPHRRPHPATWPRGSSPHPSSTPRRHGSPPDATLRCRTTLSPHARERTPAVTGKPREFIGTLVWLVCILADDVRVARSTPAS